MIIVIITEKENGKDVTNFVFTSSKEKYVKFNFRDAKNAFSTIFKTLRISSSQKYTPFINIIQTLEKSDKVVLVDDCCSHERADALRKIGAKFVHIGSSYLYLESDLYIKKIPKSIKEFTFFIQELEAFIYRPVNTLYQGDHIPTDAFQQN